MLPENSLQLMKGFWDRAEVIIVIIIIVVADVVWPIIKKRRQKARLAQMPPEPIPAPEPRPVPQREQQPAAPFEVVAPVVPAAQPAKKKKPVRKAAKSSFHTLTRELFAPLESFPQLTRATRSKEFGERLNHAVRDPRFPLSLADAAIAASSILSARVPGYRAELLQASGVGGGSVEIRQLEDLVSNPDALAIGCIDACMNDVVGLALLGPAYAALRLRSLMDSGKESVMHLNIAGGGGIALEPPAVLSGPVYAEALRSLGYKANLPEFKLRTSYLPEPEPFTLAVGGMGRQISLPVPRRPAELALTGVMDRLVSTRLDILEGKAFDQLARDTGPHDRYEKAARLRSDLASGVIPVRLSPEHLIVLADIAADKGLEAYRETLASWSTHAREARRRKSVPETGGLLPMTPGAVVEGIILADVLQRKTGRSA